MNFTEIYFIVVSVVLILANVLLTNKKTWQSSSIYIVNSFIITCVVIVYLFIIASGGFYWWRIDPVFWAYFGSFLAALLLAATIIFQTISFRQQQVENKFFELVKYYRDNVQEMKTRNPFCYKNSNKEESETEYVTGRRVIQIIFDEYCVACRIVFDLVKKNCHDNILHEDKKEEYIKHFERIKARPFIENNCKLSDEECSNFNNDRFLFNELAYMITFWGVPRNASKELDKFLKDYYDFQGSDLTSLIKKFPIVNEHAYPENLLGYFREEFNISGKPSTYVHYVNDSKEDFTKFFGGHQHQLSHFFRHLFQAVIYIDEQPGWLLNRNKKKEYIKTLRAQMSNYEQAMLFITSLSQIGRKWEYHKDSRKNLISEYDLIKDLPEHFVPDMIPDKYYRDVAFEYLDE